MEPSKHQDDLANLFQELFPWPDDVPLPTPRFGKVPACAEKAQALPVGSHCTDKTRLPFSLDWPDEELGIHVFVREREGPQGVAVWVRADGLRAELLGKAVSVALVSTGRDRFRRLTVPLDQPTNAGQGCTGEGSFGTAAELSGKLGDEVTLDVFLLE
jgi:hypothetical protein